MPTQLTRLLAALLVSASFNAHTEINGAPMIDLTKKQTFCLGRFVIDVPRDAYKVSAGYEYAWYKIAVQSSQGQQGFDDQVRQREQELRVQKHKKEASLFTKAHVIDRNNVILQYREAAVIDEMYELQAFALRPPHVYVLKDETDNDKAGAAVSDLTKILTSLRSLKPNQLPPGPGFCIDDAYFGGEPQGPHYERAVARFGFNNHPDVWLNVTIDMNGQKVSSPLLDRVKGKAVPSQFAELAKRIRTLRSGEHAVNGIEAQEILEAYPTESGEWSHSFTWDAIGKVRSIREPAIHIQMNTAKSKNGPILDKSSLADKQAIELFDAIVNSFRWRQ